MRLARSKGASPVPTSDSPTAQPFEGHRKSEGTRNSKKNRPSCGRGRRWLKSVVCELGERVMAQAKYDEFKALSSDRRGQIGVINAVRVAIGGPTTRRSASAHRRRSSSLRSAAMRARRGHSTTSIVVRRGHATKRLRHLRYLRHRTPRLDPQSAPCAPPSLRNTMSNKNNEEAETSLINDCTTSMTDQRERAISPDW